MPVSNGIEAGALVTTVKSFVVDALACVVQLLQQALKILQWPFQSIPLFHRKVKLLRQVGGYSENLIRNSSEKTSYKLLILTNFLWTA